MKRWLIILVVVMIAVLGAVAIRQCAPVRDWYYTDADTIHTPVSQARIREILWQPPRPLPEVINLPGADVYEPRLSSDGRTMYFVRGKAGEGADVYVARHGDNGWSEPTPLATINSEYDDLGPESAPDGQALYFYSDRPFGSGGYDIWVAYRRDDGRSEADWWEPVNLGPAVNSPYNDYGPAVSPDGTTLYFASNRPQPGDARQPTPSAWPATLREELFQRTYDLYAVALTDGAANQAEPLPLLNTPYNEGAPAVSAFGDFLYFASDRPGGEGGFDLYRVRRRGGSLGVVESLGATVNTPANELDPGLSLGGYRLFFSSDRTDQPMAGDHPRRYALYHTTSREVFRDVETRDRPSIHWAGMWSAIGPGLFWLLLTLLGLLALLWFMRGLKEREVSLLTKCLLTSLLIHLLLLLLFSLWQVTSSIAGEFRRGGRIQVALAPRAAGTDLARQILGSMTDGTTLPTIEFESIRPTHLPPLTPHATLISLPMQRPTLDVIEASRIASTAPEAAPHEPPVRPRFETAYRDVRIAPANRDDLATPPESRRIRLDEPPQELPRTLEVPDSHRADATPIDVTSALRPHVLIQPASDSAAWQRIHTEASLAASEILPSRDAAPEVRGPSSTGTQGSRPVDHAMTSPNIPFVGEFSERISRPDEAVATVAPEKIRPVRTPVAAGDSRLERDTTMALIAPQAEALPEEETSALFADRSVKDVRDASVVPHRTSLEVSPEPLPSLLGELALALPETEKTETANPEAAVESFAGWSGSTEASPLSLPRPRTPASESWSTAGPAQLMPEVVDLEVADAHAPTIEPNLVEARSTPVIRDVASPSEIIPSSGQEPLEGIRIPVEREQIAAVDSAAATTPAPSALMPRRPHRSDPLDALVPAASSYHLHPPEPFRDLKLEGFAATTITEVHQDATPNTVFLSSRTTHKPVPLPPPTLFELHVPRDETPPSNPYAQRTAPHRLELVERRGGSVATEEAVERALAWLARHQSADGRWDADGFDVPCGQCGGETEIAADMALTGLSTLCFLGAGHTHAADGPYRDTVARALRWLMERQGSDGDLRGTETMYTHGIATIALSEARAMTGDATLSDPVARAVRFIYRSRNRSEGGWRYDPGQPGDTSVLGWQVMALKSASMSGLPVPGEAFEVARRWLDRVDGGSASGRYAYMPGRPVTPSMTAEGMFVLQLLGHGPEEAPMHASADYVIEHLPDWESDPNTYFWYYASLALFQHGGAAWETWNAALTRELLEHQRRDGGAAGSWDPEGEWAQLGGRVYQTALCTLMLEVYYRYLPLYSPDATRPVELPADAIGTIRGSVTDAATGAPLDDALVRLIVPDGEPVLARSDRNGDYTIFVPEMPDFFAFSASREEYIPVSSNVDVRQVERNQLRVNFELERNDGDVLVLEAIPEVHHLGDDRFDGRINSRFQKVSEGDSFATTFELSEARRATAGPRAEVRMLVKGVQRRHRIVINDQTLDDRLDHAPPDGSFGEFNAGFDSRLLRSGLNTFAIIAAPSSTDIDDFEFVNVRIYLRP